jgi:DNA-3-methyladenine glycosylase I
MTSHSVEGPDGERVRCRWCGSDRLYVRYHDEEWGVPVRDDGRLFEMLLLEGAQAGLSWITVLRKRARYRELFDEFDAEKIARYDDARIDALVQDPGIIRHRGKVEAFVGNARAYLAMGGGCGAFGELVWSFKPVRYIPRAASDRVPARTSESEALSRALVARGFRFVGPTICYAFMQAIGVVDDHEVPCFRARKVH